MNIRLILCCCALIALCGSVLAATTVNVVPTAQQALFFVSTNQPTDTCSISVWTVNAADGKQIPANDVNPALFAGADQCSREGNLINGFDVILVIGKRTVELDRSGVSKASRSLQCLTTYYYQLTVGSDTQTGEFTTTNLPLGNTYNEPVFDHSRPGEYAYPTIDWTPAGKSKIYVDPLTGIGVKRMSGPGELVPSTQTGLAFMSATSPGTGWIVSGLKAVYRGRSQSKIYYRIADSAWPGGAYGKSADFVTLALSGVSSASGNSVNICITNDGINCAGATVSRELTSVSKDYTVGDTDPILKFWRNSPNVPSTLHDIRTLAGKATLAGNALTWNSGDLFSLNVSSGGLITLDGTDCVVSSVVHERLIMLREGQDGACAQDNSYSFTERNWGFLIWDSAANFDTLTINSATWNLGTSAYSFFPASGGYDLCSPVVTPGPTGNGHLCVNGGTFAQYLSSNVIFWIGDDGTSNPIGMSNGTNSALLGGGACSSSTGWAWDRRTAGLYYCLGTRASDHATVIFSVRYTGSYEPVAVPLDSPLSPATTTIVSGDISKMTASTAPLFSLFTPNSGWVLIGRQRDNLILQSSQSSQNSPAWVAVYSIPGNKIISAFNTYGGSEGSANRWDDAHSVFTTGDTDWILISAGSPFDLPYSVNITSGALTSAYTQCPPNSFGVSGSQCSLINVSSLVPTDPANGASLFGQQLLPGDFFNVTKGGADDGEQVRAIVVNGPAIWVQRAVRTYSYSLNNNHSGSLQLRVSTAALHELWVNYVDDPIGQTLTKPYGLTVLEDPQTEDCHQVYSLGVFLAGCLKQLPNVPQIPGAAVRPGPLPTSSSTTNPWNNPVFTSGMNAPFATAAYVISGNQLENHPSRSQYTASGNELLPSFDGRPYLGDLNIATSKTTSQVGTYTYKISAAGMAAQSPGNCAACVLNYRTQPFLVTSGARPVADTSPLLSDTADANFTYCYVVTAGNCWPGSTTGELYVNVPYAATPFCSSSRFSQTPSLSDICVTANTSTAHRVYQSANPDGADPSGVYTRRLTSFFSPYKSESVYWNVRATPDAKWVYGNVNNLEGGRTELMMLSLPLFPQADSFNRGTFANVPVRVGPHALAKVRARFGYAENGPADKYYCTSRQVACTTSGAPFAWVDETQKVQDCPAGCTINIPAIPGRVLYYVVERSADGKIWTPETRQILAVLKSGSHDQ